MVCFELNVWCTCIRYFHVVGPFTKSKHEKYIKKEFCFRKSVFASEIRKHGELECWAEYRLSCSIIRQIQVQKFGNTRSSNVELNVDCQAQHSPRFYFRSSETFLTRMLSQKSPVQLNICQVLLQKFGNTRNSNAELNVDGRAQYSPRFYFRMSETLLTQMLSWMSRQIRVQKFENTRNSNVELNADYWAQNLLRFYFRSSEKNS